MYSPPVGCSVQSGDGSRLGRRAKDPTRSRVASWLGFALFLGMSDPSRARAQAVPDSQGEPAGSGVVLACEQAWQAIQGSHPDVPDVVVVLGTGVERGRLVKLGHWWGGRWIADGQVRGEVLLAGEALHLQPSQVFEVLLHEAAHGLNAARGVKDSSRGGRYHNARFKTTAETVGLVVQAMPPYGWAKTSLGPAASERYEREIVQLGDAMRIARRVGREVQFDEGEISADGERRDGDKQSGSERAKPKPATCECGRKLRMAPSVLAQGPVLCGLCGQEFSVEHGAHRATIRGRSAAREPLDVGDRRFLDRRAASLAAEHERGRVSSPLRALDDDLTPLQHQGAATLAQLVQMPGGIAAIAEAGAWYEAQRRGETYALTSHADADPDIANGAARALLKLDGTLGGPSVRVDRRELLVGELVMVGHDGDRLLDIEGCELPPAGVLGTVTAIDSDRGNVDVEFPIAGQHRVALESPAASALLYGYAERSTEVGAPLIDLRTLPTAPSTVAEPLAPVVELTR